MKNKKLKYFVDVQKGKLPKTFSKDNHFPVYLSMEYLRGNENDIRYVEDENVVFSEEDDILILWDGSNAGEILLSKKGVISSTTAILKPKQNLNKSYLFYQLKSSEQYFKDMSVGMGIPHVNPQELLNFSFFIPSIEEQSAIATYLDQKTTEIDQLIADKKRLLELYEEEKNAIINQAVTKGINPDVPMKDSGIEWLGEIPEHWEVKRLRYLGDCKNGINKSAEYFGKGYPFLNYSDVYKNLILPLNPLGLIESNQNERQIYSVEKGDVFFTRTSETAEEIGFASVCLKTIENAVFAGFLIRFRPSTTELINKFSGYYFRSNIHRRFFTAEMNLVTRASLSQELLKRMPVLLPPIKEQQSIVQYIESETARIDEKIENTQKLIDLLTEYRTALISEVVTGKVKVVND